MCPKVDAQEFVKFNYWDCRHKDLLSGEWLYLDLKLVGMAYHDQNKREHEVTLQVSIRQLDLMEIMKLKTTVSCGITYRNGYLTWMDPVTTYVGSRV